MEEHPSFSKDQIPRFLLPAPFSSRSLGRLVFHYLLLSRSVSNFVLFVSNCD